MKSKAMSLLISIVITSLYFAATSGQQAKDSLSQYMEIAAKHNPDILQSFNEYQAALQKVFQVGGLPDPEINIGVFLSPMELVSGNQVADLQLMQMFPWFGTLRNAKDEMSQMAQAKYEAFMDVKLQVYYEVQQTYYELFKVKQGINISEKNIDIMHTIERLALVKFKTTPAVNGNTSSSGSNVPASVSQSNAGGSAGMGGMGDNTGNNNTAVSQKQSSPGMQGNSMGSFTSGSSLSDLYRIQIEIGELENNTALLKNQQNSLIAQFNGYLNRDAMSRVFLPDSLPIEILNMPLEDISDSMLVNNPMLGMLQYEQQSLDARKKMAIKMGYPMIGLGLNYTVINKNEMSTSTMNGKDMVMPMVTLTLPVYRKKYRALQEEADLLKTAKAQNYASAVNSLKTQYYQAVQSYQDAQRRIVLYTNQGRLAGQSFNIMVKSFAADGSGLTDILRVFQQTLDYDYKKIEAITDFNAAVARLKQLMALQQPSTDL